MQPNFSNLPIELLTIISHNIRSYEDLLTFLGTCKNFHEVCEVEHYWRDRCVHKRVSFDDQTLGEMSESGFRAVAFIEDVIPGSCEMLSRHERVILETLLPGCLPGKMTYLVSSMYFIGGYLNISITSDVRTLGTTLDIPIFTEREKSPTKNDFFRKLARACVCRFPKHLKCTHINIPNLPSFNLYTAHGLMEALPSILGLPNFDKEFKSCGGWDYEVSVSRDRLVTKFSILMKCQNLVVHCGNNNALAYTLCLTTLEDVQHFMGNMHEHVPASQRIHVDPPMFSYFT